MFKREVALNPTT